MRSHCRHILAAALFLQAFALPSCGGDPAPTQAPPSEPDLAATRFNDAARRALLTNLLDDSDLPRWNALDNPMLCMAASTVTVDGKPLAPGTAVPLGGFRLGWQLEGACPLGPDGPQLSGELTMMVLRDDELGMVPLISPVR